MNNRKSIVLMLAIVLIGILVCAPSLADEIKYVRTNGGHLNVRNLPDADSDVIARLSNGDRVTVVGYFDDFVELGAPTYGYVAKRYLSSKKPSTSPSSSSSSSAPAVTSDAQALSGMNTQFRSMQVVNPYTVYVRPSRPGGFVNLRWAPSTEAEVQQRCYVDYELEVLAVGNSWLQVKDVRTARVGFIMKSLVD